MLHKLGTDNSLTWFTLAYLLYSNIIMPQLASYRLKVVFLYGLLQCIIIDVVKITICSVNALSVALFNYFSVHY